MINIVTHRDHAYTAKNFVAQAVKQRRVDLRLIDYQTLFEAKSAPIGHYVFTDFDRLTAYEMQVAAVIARRVEKAAPEARILNRPERVLERYPLLRRLARDGHNDFSAYRIDSLEMPKRYPVFIRSEDDCKTPDTPLLNSEAEYLAAIERLRGAGVPMKRRIAVEFCAEPSPDGLYRKYGVFRIGRQLVAQHVFHHTDWYVKRSTRSSADGGPLHDERIAFARDNPHAPAVQRAFDIAGIDYGRIDYAIVGGRLQTYEINTNPAYQSRPGQNLGSVNPDRRQAFRDRLYAAFNEIDVPIARRGVVRFELPEPVFQFFPGRPTLIDRARGLARRLVRRS